MKFPLILALAWIGLQINVLGDSGPSGVFTVIPPEKSLTLAWNAPADPSITRHRVYVGTQRGQGNFFGETSNVSELSLNVGSLQSGRTYYFSVSAVNGSGVESAPSAELAVVIATPPLPSAIEIATSEIGRRSLNWSFPLADLGSSPDFIVYQSPDMQNWTVADIVTADRFTGFDSETVSYKWPIQGGEKTMFYRLTARNWLGYSTEQTEPSSGESLTLALNAPAGPDIASHRIYMRTGSGRQSLYKEIPSGSELTFTVTNLQRGNTYYFVATPVNGSGVEGDSSGEFAIVIDTPPLPSDSGIVSSVSGWRDLKWTFPRIDLGSSPEFVVYQSPDLVNWTVADVVPASAANMGDETADFSWPIQDTSGTMFYRLTARNWMGYSTGP